MIEMGSGDAGVAADERDTVECFLAAVNSHDPEQLRGVIAPDFLFEEAAGRGEASIRALQAELEMVVAAFPDMAFRPVRQTPEGDRWYVEFKAIGTHRGEFLQVPPTGALAILSGVFNLRVQDDLVRELRLTADFGGLRRQLLLAARMV